MLQDGTRLAGLQARLRPRRPRRRARRPRPPREPLLRDGRRPVRWDPDERHGVGRGARPGDAGGLRGLGRRRAEAHPSPPAAHADLGVELAETVDAILVVRSRSEGPRGSSSLVGRSPRGTSCAARIDVRGRHRMLDGDSQFTQHWCGSALPPLDPPPLVVPLTRLAPTRQPRLPRVRRRRLPDRVAARCSRATPGSAPTSTARRRGSSRASSAGRGAGAPARPSAAGSSSTRTSSTRPSTAPRSRAATPAGRASGSGDRVPDPARAGALRVLARPRARLLRPELVLAVGGLAIRRLLGLRSLDLHRRAFERGGATVVPLPHPSGVSRWPNVPANRARLDRALALVRARLEGIEKADS